VTPEHEVQNPFGMDETCTNCPALSSCRESVVHGYGDVSADFLVIGPAPGPGADESGIPFTGDTGGERLQWILHELGFSRSPPEATEPELRNVFLTYLTRCRHPERGPTDEEVATCEPYLNGELRMINPEILIPIGERVLEAMAREYTMRDPDGFDLPEEHATTIRGRGFELIPMRRLEQQTDEDAEAIVEHIMENVLGRDYRQTKGRRER
jgi:Uracil-DNA glycosylase